jgi:branched-chain amino acid transport system substrate-binding protein
VPIFLSHHPQPFSLDTVPKSQQERLSPVARKPARFLGRISISFEPRLLRRVVLSVLLVLLLPHSSVEAVIAKNLRPIRIGAIFSESGIAAQHNQPLIEMTRLAVSQVNNTGGVLGRPLQLILVDNHSTPIGSAEAAELMVQQDVTAVIGAHWSSHSLAIAPILQAAGIPMISPGSTNPMVTKGRNYIFRACFLDSFQGIAMAKFARSELHAKSAVILSNVSEDYSTMLGQFFRDAFAETGGRILSEMVYRGDATDFSADIAKLIRLKPDVVYLPGYTRDSGLCIKQAAKMGCTAVFLGGDAWDEIEKYAGAAVNGDFQSAPWHPNVPFEASRKMRELYFSTYGRKIVNNSSPLAYDAVMLLADAIRRAGTVDHKAVRDALAATTGFQGATGTITFDENGDPLGKAIIVVQYRGQKPIFKKTITP